MPASNDATEFLIRGDGGVNIAGTVVGDGPPVLLIHGFPDDRSLWSHQVAALVGAGHTCVAVDQRGFGASDKPQDWKASRAHHAAADMIAVLDALGFDRSDVVGHDWGAATASFLSMFYGDRIRRLALMSAGHPGAFRTLGLDQLERAWYMHFFQAVDVAAEWLRADGWANLRLWGRHPEIETVIERMSRPGALEAGLRWYRANVHPATFLPPSRPLPRLVQPTMGIWSADDDHLVEDFVRSTQDWVDGPWRYERIADAGHWMQLDQPEAVSDLLVDFLSGSR